MASCVKDFKAYPYQEEIVQKALQQNSIICLATGTGKTFISAMVIKEYFDGSSASYDKNGKRIFFCVNSVPLVTQQAKEIRRHTCLTVGEYRGDMNVDSWTTARWIDEFNKHDVFVMTGQILCNLLLEAKIRKSHIGLLVFDECHNASGDHNYNQILRVFESSKTPPILGLTASIINEKYKNKRVDKEAISEYLEKKMRNLESRMRSICITCVDAESVSKYIRKPVESLYVYKDGYSNNGFGEIVDVIKTYTSLFEQLSEKCKNIRSSGRKKRRSEVPFDALLNLLRSGNLKVSSVMTVEIILDVSRYMNHILESLGPLSCYKAAEIMLEELGKKHFPDSSTQLVESCVDLIQSYQKAYEKAVNKTSFQTIENVYPMEPFITAKASLFLSDVLHKEKLYFKELGTDLHAIIFTRRRCTAVILSHLINAMVVRDMPTYEGIWSEPILGHSMDSNLKLVDSNMKSKDQDEILDRFRRGEFSVLVATSVVEEGLDVRKCNLVVKFDGLFNYREYVQSKGRARSNQSKFIVMSSQEDANEMERTLKVMQIMEEILFEKCHNRELPDEMEIEDALFDEDEDDMPTYFSLTNSNESARVTKCSAVALVYRYCNSLSKDEYSNTQPYFGYERTKGGDYQISCVLPMSCPLPKRTYKSCVFESKDKCKRSLCLQICKLLHEAGELSDEFLLPVSHDKTEEEFGDEIDVDENDGKTKEYYNRIIPSCLQYKDNFSSRYHDLYLIDMRLVQPNERSIALWGFWFKENLKKFGVLLPTDIPQLPVISVHTRAGKVNMECQKICSNVNLKNEDVLQLKRFHEKVFEENSKQFIYGEFKMALNDQNGCKALIVPLNNSETGLDYSYLNQFCNDIAQQQSLNNRVVRKTYIESQRNRDYLVESITDLTPLSPMENGVTFADYYKDKYKLDLKPNQYLFKVVPLSGRVSYTVQTERKKPQSPPREEKLVPQLCELASHLNADLFLQTHCLPFLFYATESWLTVDDLRALFAKQLGISLNSVGGDAEDVDMTSEDSLNPIDYLNILLRGSEKVSATTFSPSVTQLWECITTRQALLPFDLERLEMLGDSFLKLSITIFLFYKYPTYDEGRLTKRRVSEISNRTLFKIAKRLKIQHMICNSQLGITNPESENKNPKTVWLPPGFKRSVNNSNNSPSIDESLPYQLVQDKCLADTIEAMIGLYLKLGGVNLALAFMSKVLKIKVFHHEIGNMESQKATSSYADFPVIKSALRGTVTDKGSEVEKLYRKGKLHDIENKLKYKFMEHSHLVQAMTHLSYQQNHVTGCYQRYEFLGDAILDFLVTSHVYAKRPDYSPGQLTSIRSALVNNNTFALLAIKLKLYEHLFQQSSSLYDDYNKFKAVVDESDMETLLKNPFIIVSKITGEGLHAPKVLGDMIESLAGAIFLDSGCNMVKVWEVFYPIFESVIDRYLKNVPINPVRQLMEKYADAKFTYSDDSLSCVLHIHGNEVVSAFGKNKKIAKASCCARFLRDEENLMKSIVK